MAELAFEYFAGAIETARGTAITTPTRVFTLDCSLKPEQEKYRPSESRGVLANTPRSKTVKRWSSWGADGGLDTRVLLFLLSMGMQNTPTPTVVTAAQTWTWLFKREMTSDAIRSATLWFGDPNMSNVLRAAFGMAEEVKLSGDMSGDGGAMMSAKGLANFPSKVASPSLPAIPVAPLFAMADTELFLDTSSALGTTAVNGRLIDFELTIPTGVKAKYYAVGPTGTRTFTKIGREKDSPTLAFTLELEDYAQYDLYANNSGDDIVKTRIRLNGPIIETTNRHFVQIDAYAPLDNLDWGDYENANRTIKFESTLEYDATSATDLSILIQTNTGTL